MFGSIRRPRTSLAGVRFCDSCAEVSTPAQRAERRYAATRATTYPLINPR
ncbi:MULTISPECIES: hypothetical protein [Micromonospora]|nr:MULTISPECIES: hypothetical protein [Micromonospora]